MLACFGPDGDLAATLCDTKRVWQLDVGKPTGNHHNSYRTYRKLRCNCREAVYNIEEPLKTTGVVSEEILEHQGSNYIYIYMYIHYIYIYA